MGQEPSGQIGGLVESRQGPGVGDPVERPEERDDLGEAAIERLGLVRPGNPRDSIPERLAVDRVVEHDGVPELPHLAPGEPMAAGLVPRQPARVGGSEVGRAAGRKRALALAHDTRRSGPDGTERR